METTSSPSQSPDPEALLWLRIGFTHSARSAELLRKSYLCNITDGHALNPRDYLKEAEIRIANIIHGQVISKMPVQKGPKEWRNLKNRVDVSQKRGSCADNESCSGLIEVRGWSNEERERRGRQAGVPVREDSGQA